MGGDPSRNYGSAKSLEANDFGCGKKASQRDLATSRSKRILNNTIVPFNHGKGINGAVGDAALFFFKVAALETVRRFSKAKCPFAWRGLQALQVLCYPPLKWIQKWTPFKGLVKGMQNPMIRQGQRKYITYNLSIRIAAFGIGMLCTSMAVLINSSVRLPFITWQQILCAAEICFASTFLHVVSRPLLVISIATSFSCHPKCPANDGSNSPSCSEAQSEVSSTQISLDTRTLNGTPHGISSENWLLHLYKELENQGITLPKRFNENELRRFYTAASGDFACLLSSIKKTISWRDTYHILSDLELEEWSHMVFWHGFDVKHRPCLIVRLGLACTILPSHERPRFAQAVVSQVEHGVFHLVDEENPEIVVLLDCEGLSPFRFPMKMMKSCCYLLQDHFPNRLGCLFIIRLPSVVRVLAQTFIQVLKPVTRKKLKIGGDMYKKFLSQYLQILPSYLDGKCTCTECSKLDARAQQSRGMRTNNGMELSVDGNQREDLIFPHHNNDIESNLNGSGEQLIRTAIISLIMLWVLIAVIAGMNDPGNRIF